MTAQRQLISTQRELLDFFLKHPYGEYSRRQLAREGYGPPQQIDKHLIRLHAEGQLDEIREGDEVYYTLSKPLRRILKQELEAEKNPKTLGVVKPLEVISAEVVPTEVVPTEVIEQSVDIPAPQVTAQKSRVRKNKNGYTRNQIDDLLKSSPESEVTIKFVADLFGISDNVAGKHLRTLMEEKKVKISRKTPEGYLYQTILPARVQSPPRHTKLDIFELFQNNPSETYTAEGIAGLLGISVRDAHYHLKNLSDEHKIQNVSTSKTYEFQYKVSIVPPESQPTKTTALAAALTASQARRATETPPVVKSPYIMFLRSIVQRLKDGQSLNQYDIQALDEHINSL